MRVDRTLQVLGARGVLHGQHRLGDQLTGERTDDVYAQDLVIVLRRDDLRKALRMLHGARPAAGEEREDTDLVGAAARLDLLLGLAHPGDLGGRVDDRWNSLGVDFTEASGD